MRSPAGLISLGVRNPVMANLAMLCMLVGGFLATKDMVRESYPEFSLDHIGIDVAYPGASPEDVEQSITIKIEDAITGVPGIREVSSSSTEGGCTIYALLHSEVTDVDRVVKDIQDRIQRITTLPIGAEDPVVSERVVRTQVIGVALAGDVSQRTLEEWAKKVRDDLIADSDLSQIVLTGVRQEEISIEVSEEALQRWGLSFADVMEEVARASVDLPGGTLRTADEEITLRTLGQRYTAADFENLVVISAPDGTLIRLGQIAAVRDSFEETVRRGWFNGQPATMIGVYKTPAQDTTTIARKVREYVSAQQAELPEGLTMSIWADTSLEVDGRLRMLLGNGLAGIALVMLTLWLFLDWRLSFWVALGIPVAFAGALIILGTTGQTLNMISLVALIMVTGIIVDDAIVIAEHIHTLKTQGMEPVQACINGAREMALPVLGSSATTIAAFIPLLYVSGVMGRFLEVLPIVVVAAVAASAIEAFWILPAHLRHGLPGGRPSPSRLARLRRLVRGKLDAGTTWLRERAYLPALRAAVRHRWITLAVAAACLMVTVGMVVGGHTPVVLFPEGESNLLRARVRFPEGTPAPVCEAAVRQLERAIWQVSDQPDGDTDAEKPAVRQVSSVIGEWTSWWRKNGSHLGEVTAELFPAADRQTTGAALLDAWRNQVGIIHDALSVEMIQVELSPTEKPLEIRLHGRDLEQLRLAADEIRERLATYAGVHDIDDDLIPGKRELRITLKPVARTLGLTVADLASQLREGFFGGEAVRVLRGRSEVKVQVRYPPDERRTLADLERTRIRSAAGQEIPFAEAANVQLVRGYSAIWRQDGRRRVRVRANVDEHRANAEQVLDDMTAEFLPALERRLRSEDLDAGFSYSIGGQRAQMRESLSSLGDGYAMALVAIYAILASITRSYVQPLIIVLAIPLGMAGVVAGHRIMGYELTIVSVFGAVGLSGVVVNDALVLVVRISRLVRAGRPVLDAVIEGGQGRFRAVVLTTMTTVAGLLPLLTERSNQARQLIPMAISLGFGLAFATVLTLLVVPALYLATNDLRRLIRWLRRGGAYPNAEAVEEVARAVIASPMRTVVCLAVICCGLTGCGRQLDGVETILRRRSAALARLPDTDTDWKGHYAPETLDRELDPLASPGVLELARAREIALRANPDIHAARARIEQGLARIGEAQASYYPVLTLGHTSTRTLQTPQSQNRFDLPTALQPATQVPTSLQDLDLSSLLQVLASPVLGSRSIGGIGRSFSQHSSTLAATWTLFDGFSREATVLAAKHAHSAARMSLADAQRLLSQAVEAAYFRAQLGRERLRIARADEGFSHDQLEVARKKLGAGKATQADVLNFEVRLRAAQVDVVASIGLLNNARTVLAELMGIDDALLPDHVELAVLAEETEREMTPPDAEEWVARAWASRPDLAQTEFEVKSKSEEVRAAKGQFSPSVLLSGSYGFDRISNLGYSTDDQASAGAVEFRWQLFTGGFRTSRLRFTEAQRWELAANLRRLRQRVASEVRQAVIALIDAQEQARLQRLNLASATENRRIVEAEYAAGKASLVRLNEAQRDLVDTDAALAQARIRLRQAWSDLHAAAPTDQVEE